MICLLTKLRFKVIPTVIYNRVVTTFIAYKSTMLLLIIGACHGNSYDFHSFVILFVCYAILQDSLPSSLSFKNILNFFSKL